MNRRGLLRTIVIAAALAALPVAGTASAGAAVGSGGFLLGVYYGNQGWAMEQVRALETWQEKRHAVVNLFTNWDANTKVRTNLFTQQLPNIWASGNVPMITWEPFTGKRTPADIERRIAAGEYDGYVRTWAESLKGFLDGHDGTPGTGDDRRAYLRPAHEMNGDWYPWSGPAADFVAMWRRVHRMFGDVGIPPEQLQWVWAVNHTDAAGVRAEDYYPGDGFVDWVGVDGYNWGATQEWSSWLSPAEVLDPMVRRVRALAPGRPVALTETASTSATPAGADVAAKSAWIGAFFEYAATAGVRMVAWFNTDKETDWAVFGGSRGDTTVKVGRTSYRAYSAYKAALGRAPAVSPVAGNDRLLTDDQFAGIIP